MEVTLEQYNKLANAKTKSAIAYALESISYTDNMCYCLYYDHYTKQTMVDRKNLVLSTLTIRGVK